MPNKLVGLTMRIGGAILCAMLLNQISVGDFSGCNCCLVFLLHAGVCLFAIIFDHTDSCHYHHTSIKIVLRILCVVIDCILSIISISLGHLLCAGGMFLASLLFLCISVYTEN